MTKIKSIEEIIAIFSDFAEIKRDAFEGGDYKNLIDTKRNW